MSRENNQSQSSIKRALKAVENMQTKLEAIEYSQREPIAIVGIGCRFPAGANNPEQFWHFLHNGVDAITEVPKDRWDIDEYYSPDRETLGKVYTRNGGFLQDVDLFDPHFFGISPKEALSLDPQHRLLLEVTWEALEDGGKTPESLKNSSTGVFIGIGRNDYGQKRLTDSSQNEEISIYDGTGNSLCFASGRISYLMGLQGPNMAIETACSSSLVAVHIACQSLRTQECNLAIAGGVNLNLSPEVIIFLSRSQTLSPDGRCKTFDARADGFGYSEGCGVVILKRLSDAIANGDKIWATIRGSAVNHDGPSSGITVPNQIAQEKLIRQALTSAKVDPTEVDYVEAHGTGTSLGDPIEVGALASVLCRNRSHSNPLVIGSVKTNLGHLEAAAGIVGLIKVVLSLHHEEIPPHLHLSTPNPHIPWNEIPVVVPTSPRPWSGGNKSRIAGVSSFGFSGTNAHVILEEAPIQVKRTNIRERPVQILTLSAKTREALEQLVSNYQNYLEIHPELAIVDICYTANAGRSHFEHRLAVISRNEQELVEKLISYKRGEERAGVYSGKPEKNHSKTGKIAFLFTGQGSQYVNMGLELYQTQSVFREALEKCDRILGLELDHSLLSIIYPKTTNSSDSSLLDQTAYTQPALFAFEYALAQLWLSWGVKPNIVMGHSVGEYVAACVAGVFSLEEGLKLIAHRGRLMQKPSSEGKMLAVMASETQVKEAIGEYSLVVAIAAINEPESVVISGESEAIAAICSKLEATGVKTKHLQVSHAFHSPLMEPMLAEFAVLANNISYNQPKIPIISNVTGKRADNSIATGRYWVDHVRQPVKFARGMEILYQQGYETYLEIGPQPILLGMGRKCLPERVGGWLPSLRPGVDEWQQMLSSLGKLYVEGLKVDWSGFDKGYSRQKVVLPTYPFQRQRYWIEISEDSKSSVETEKTNTAIFNLLSQGETEKLTEQLKQTGNLSAQQQQFLPDILEILAKQHQQQLAAAQIQNWYYQLKWKPLKQSRQKINTEASHWLILADRNGVGKNLAEKIQAQGNEATLVYWGEQTETQAETERYQVDPEQEPEWEKLIKTIDDKSKLPIKKIIHLWNLDTPKTEDLTIEELEKAQSMGVGTAIQLLQGIVRSKLSAKLWLITRGTQPVLSPSAATEIVVAASLLWGLGKVVSLEHPELWGGMIDLDPETSETETKKLQEIIEAESDEDHIAIRGEKTYIARLVKQNVKAAPPLSFSSEASYLITGGLGGLGLKTAQWMVEKGARHLVLIGRKAPSQEKQATVNDLEQKGAEVIVAQADVCNREQLSKVFEQIDTSMPSLKGIVHAAGVLGDFQMIEQMEISKLKVVMAPKIIGGWILHQLTKDRELDFFVNFSSIASVWGSAGQCDYGASNHFLDGLAHYRQAKGLPSLTINWGAWSGGGMAGEAELKELSKRGVESLSPEQGLAALEQLWVSGNIQTVVANINWSLFKQLYEMGRRRLLLAEIEVQELETKLSNSQSKSEILTKIEAVKQIEAASESEGINLLLTHLQKEVGKILGVQESELISPQTGFFEMGMDSLMSVELRNRLSEQLEVNLPSTLTFDFPNIEQLSQYLANEVLTLTDRRAKTQQKPIRISDINEPIAIIGMSCRFPGGAVNPQKFWELLSSGKNTRGEIPQERWDLEAWYDPSPEVPGKIYTRYGNFVEKVEEFDPGFFGISPREAIAMDPQQRLLLEVSWEALEMAATVPERLAEASIGVFVGNDGQDYQQLIFQELEQNPNSPVAAFAGTGNVLSSIAGRLSYSFGFTGPTMTIDTACSSSLVAIHQACASLRLGECNMAIAGGVKLNLTPNSYIFTAKARMISADGLCKTFDASADGFSRGEGCGMVVIKRLSDAQQDGDNILAVIRGSAVNQDGPSSGLTVPNGQAQQRLIRQALAQAQVEPTDISYLEAHGTGTSLGDPIELNAAAAVLAAERESESPLLVGSVKTNIGHLEAAAGVSGLIKVVLAMQNQQIPAHLNLETPNPKIDWSKWPIEVPRDSRPWQVSGKPRLAGVSSFGFTGTNAHVILEEAPSQLKSQNEEELRRPVQILTLSAKTKVALDELVSSYQNHLETHPELELADICYTANTGRSHFEQRLAVISSNQQELVEKLKSYQRGEETTGVYSGEQQKNSSASKIAFLFTGQGSHYVNMGRELYETQPVFRAAVDECDKILTAELEHPLTTIIYKEADSGLLNQTSYTQPAIFALEYALAKLWESWGIKPDIVMGHSVGEYVAACVAGVFNLEDGLKLIATRGRLMQELPTGGEMVAVMASVTMVKEVIGEPSSVVAIAAINGPESVVISGESEAIAQTLRQLESEGIKTQKLQVSHAFHSPLMEPMLAEFEVVVNNISYNQPQIPIISNLTGKRADNSIATGRYWVNHVRQPVQFAQGMVTLDELGYETFLEIGPKPILLGMGRDCLQVRKKMWLPSLRTGKKDWQQMLQSLGQLYIQGWKINWSGFDKDYSRQKVVLPTYPWQQRRYWITDIKDRKNAPPLSQSEEKQTKDPVESVKLEIPASNQSFGLRISKIGLLKNLTLKQIKRQPPESQEVEVEVRAVGLNFRELLGILGFMKEYYQQLGINSTEDIKFGGECSGKIVATGADVKNFQVGDEVIVGMASGCLSSFVTVNSKLVVRKPQKLSFAEAATLPVAFLTAYHGLYQLAKIKPGESILIHAAAGGVGQAAVQLAQKLGAKIFATANPNKWKFLQSQGIESKNIMNSRTLEFADDIMAKTQRRGVDVVLNSLTHGEFIEKGFEVLAQGGRFVELSKIGIWSQEKVSQQRPDAKYFPFDFLEVSSDNPGIVSEILTPLMEKFNTGDLNPLPYKVFPVEEAIEAYRYMQHSKHIGKIVVTMTEVKEILTRRLIPVKKYSYYLSRDNKTVTRTKIKLSNINSIPKTKKPLLELTENTEQVLSSKLKQEKNQIQTQQQLAANSHPHVDLLELKQALKAQLADALYVEVSEIDEEQKFIDLGLDSIVGVEWIATINQTYGLDIKVTQLYDYPSLTEMTEYIAKVLSNQANKSVINTQEKNPTIANKNIHSQQPPAANSHPQVDLSELKQALKAQLADALYAEVSEIDEEQKFIDLGLDSIVGVEWIATINQTYGLDIKVTQLYDYPSLTEMTEYIAQVLSNQANKSVINTHKKNPTIANKKNIHSRLNLAANIHPQFNLLEIEQSPEISQESLTKELRLILEKVAKKELSIQVANQMIQELKQKAKNKS